MSLFQPIAADKKMHIVLLGCGNITKRHAQLLKKIDGNLALSFASRNLTKAQTYQQQLNGVTAFGSYEAAIAAPDVDVVMVNTPPNSHFELAEQALRLQKHVIVEKPPFFYPANFDTLKALSLKNKRQIFVAENYFYRPLRRKIVDLLHSNVIGRPLFVHINATKTQRVDDWRGNSEEVGYGALFEGGIHWINFINNLGYSITKVRGAVPHGYQEGQLERSIQVMAETENGPVINLSYSWETAALFGGLRWSKIQGTEGSITFESNGLLLFLRGKKIRIALCDIPSHIGGYRLMFEDFLQALRTGQSPELTFDMAKRDLEIVANIYESLGN